MSIRFIDKMRTSKRSLLVLFGAVISVILISLNSPNGVFAIQRIGGSNLTDQQMMTFSQNDILFYDPSACIGGSSSGVCGDNVKEKIWSILRQSFDPIHTAAAFGNVARDGGFQPVKWEYGKVVSLSTCSFVVGWDDLYEGRTSGVGVGDFGLTTGLSDYLHYVNDKAPDLLQYFKDPSNTCYSTGDELAEKIGQDVVDRLLELEFNYFINEWIPKYKGEDILNHFKGITDVGEAARYWAHNIEVCAACGYDGGDSELYARAAAANGYYEEYKNFTCTATSSSISSSNLTEGVSGGITLIGDSISVMSEKELQEKLPGAFMSKVGSRHPTSAGACDDDKGGLEVLRTIASGSGKVKNQNSSGDCSDLTVDNNSLKENVIWELGTNLGGATEETINKVIDLVGKQRKLFLVTPYNGKEGDAKNNTDAVAEMYRKVAENNSNVYIVDWNKAVRDKQSDYVLDEGYAIVHPTDAGKKLLAELIAEAVGSTANCAMSSSYKDSAYKRRLEGLNTFNQGLGTWKDEAMCPGSNDGYTIAGSGCGIMSLYAAYYMFTGEGMNNSQVFNAIRSAAKEDGYNGCMGSEPNNHQNGAIEKYTGIKIEGGRLDENSEKYYQDSDWDTLVDNLKSGKKIIIEVHGGEGPSKFTSGYHYMLLDHYDAEKDAVLLFDPSMGQWKVDASGVSVGPTGDIGDGVYVNRRQMLNSVIPHGWWTLTYYGQACNSVCEGSEGGLKAGGMTKEEAEEFIKPYYNEAIKRKTGAYGENTTNGIVIGNGIVGDAGCANGTLNNCVAFSQWFVNNYTDYGPGAGTDNGVGYAGTLIRSYGLEDGGTTPRAYAIFSTGFGTQYGHTGVVLGVDEERGVMYTGEAHCGVEYGFPEVNEISLSTATSGAYRYAYTDGKLKTEKFTK